MAASTVTKVIRSLGLPKDRAGFIAAYDGNTDALSDLQQAFESLGDKDPEALKLWQSASASGGGAEDVAAALADTLYPSKGGIKGKVAPVDETTESNLPVVESKAEKETLAPVPAKPAAKKAAKKAKAKPAAEKPAAAQAAATQAAPAPTAAAPAPARPAPPDELSGPDDPLPGMFGITQGDLEPEPIPGGMGLTRDDVARYLNVDGMLGEPADEPAMNMGRLAAAVPPPAQPAAVAPMDMGRLAAAAPAQAPPAAALPPGLPPAPGLSAADMEMLLGNFQTPSAAPAPLDLSELIGGGTANPRSVPPSPAPMDMGRLSSAVPPQFTPPNLGMRPGPDAPTLFPQPTPQDNPWRQMGNSPLPEQEVSGMAASGEAQPYRPVTSMVDNFMKARGLDGINTGTVTKPIDFAIRNSPWLLPPAAMGAYNYATSNDGTASDAEMQELVRQRDEARANAEKSYGGFTKPPMTIDRPPGRAL